MQRTIVLSLLIVFSLLVQTVILPDFPSVKIWSDLLFYLIIILGLRFSLVTGVILSVVIGYFADSVSMAPYGTSVVSYVLTLLFIRKVMANIYLENRLSLFFWVAIFSLFKQTIQLIIFMVKPGGYDINIMVFWGMLLQSVWDALLGLFIVPLLEKMLFTDWSMVLKRKGLRD